jgi:histidine triad (HIT) family protein
MSSCIFCRIVAGEVPSAKVYEDELTLAFMDIGQVNPGHVIVAVKPHRETILDLDDALASAVFRTAARVARAAEAALHPGGITVLQANRKPGWQTVPHMHLHVLPRHDGDGVGLTWPAKNPPFPELQSLAEKLRAALG